MPRRNPAEVPILGAGAYYGRALSFAGAGGFRVRESSYRSGLKTPWHRHDRPYFAYTHRGVSHQMYPAETLQCCPGTLVFHPADEVHRDAFVTPEVRVLQIEIEPSRLGVFEPPLGLLPPSKNLAQPIISCLASRIHAELGQMDELSPLVIEGLVLELLANLLRVMIHPLERKAPPWLCRADELIRQRFAQPLRLSAIAEEIGVHLVHLAREFRKHYGCTVGEKVRRLRVEYACGEIARSNRPLLEIALAAGFADQSHFSKVFRSHTGMTPSQFSSEFRRANRVPAS
jgi:AraC family transcriptional regulator